jgi:phage N-6-adenine-methyltransferase
VSLSAPALVSSTARSTPGARDDWRTPASLFDALDDEFGFTLDAAATQQSAKARRYYTPQDDALTIPWGGRGEVIWLNPPYGRGVERWVGKAYTESRLGAVVVVLLFSRTDTKWWHEFAMRADEVRFIKGRVRFGLADGSPKAHAPAPSCLLVFTPWSAGPPRVATYCQPS